MVMSAQEMYPEDELSGELAVSETELAVNGLHLVANEAKSSLTSDSERFAIDQMAQHRILTAAEEVVLAKRIERGDRAARQEMIENNYKLVISIAANYLGHGLSLLELVQEGIAEGLTTAVDKFDHRRGYKFSTYASWWIRQACQRAIFNKANTIRIPVHIGERQVKLNGTAATFEKENGREPTIDELVYLTNMEPEHIEEALNAPYAHASLNKPVGEEGDGELIEMFADDSDRSVGWEDEIDEETRKEKIHELLNHMESEGKKEGMQYAQILRLRYGIGGNGQEPMTSAQVGEIFGISSNKVRKVEERALRNLKNIPGLKEMMQDDDNFEPGRPAGKPNRVPITERMKQEYDHPKLSPIENIIIGLMISTRADKISAAKKADISPNTVKAYMSDIIKKLGAADYKDAVRIACEDLGLA